MRQCYKCGKEWVSDKKQPSFKEFCDDCSAYLHCCLNCRFYDKHAHNHCRIPTTEWVADREGPNFCEDLEFADAAVESAGNEEKRNALDAFDALFDESPEGAPHKGPTDFKKLFGD